MKISDLLGEGWESDQRTDATTEPDAAGYPPPESAPPPPSVVSVPPTVANPASPEPVDAGAPDVITSLASWAPAPEPVEPDAPAPPVSARAQLADLAAGLAISTSAPVVEEEPDDAPDDLAALHLVVDDLLPCGYEAEGLVARVFS